MNPTSRRIAFRLPRGMACGVVLLICALSPLSFAAAQPSTPCPSTTPSGASALLAAAEACLQPWGPLLERNAAQALVYVQNAVSDQLTSADLARAYDVQGEAHFWLGALGQAIARQTQAIVLEPTAERYLWRAVTMDRVGDTAGAIADAEQAIAFAPRQLDFYLWLGQYALDHDANDLALDVMERAATVAPDDADVLRLLGDAHYALSDYAAAKTVYESYLTFTDNPLPVVIAKLQIIERRLGS